MINDHLDKTIACLIADAEYLSDFEFMLDSFNGKSKEDQQNMVKSLTPFTYDKSAEVA